MKSGEQRVRAPGRPMVAACFAAKPGRVSWLPLADLLDRSDRSPFHSGRPSLQEVPTLNVARLRALGAADGLMLDLAAEEGGLRVAVLARAAFRPDGGELHLSWELKPSVGDPYGVTLPLPLVAVGTGGDHPRYLAHCGCGRRVIKLLWAVDQFCCSHCLGVVSEADRQGPRYTAERMAREARAKIGADPQLLSPIIAKGRRQLAVARRIHELEMRVVRGLGGRE